MRGILGKIIDEYHRRYEEILDAMYPSFDQTGLQERNLTVNFLAAAETVEEKEEGKTRPTFLWWTEFQFGDGKHLDGVAFDLEAKEVFLIESKRHKGEKQAKETEEDVGRILSVASDIEKLNSRFNAPVDLGDFSVYGVILADSWVGPSQKRGQAVSILNEWQTRTFFSGRCSIPNAGCLYFEHDKTIDRFVKENIPDCVYHLLTFVWKIK